MSSSKETNNAMKINQSVDEIAGFLQEKSPEKVFIDLCEKSQQNKQSSKNHSEITVPADAEKCKEELKEVLASFEDGTPAMFYDIRPGWYPLIIQTHKKMIEIFPDYKIAEIKQKFASLRFYWHLEEDPLQRYFQENVLQPPELPKEFNKLSEEKKTAYVEADENWFKAFQDWLWKDPIKQLLSIEKEKYKKAHRIIAEAEDSSTTICEICGNPGKVVQTKGNWFYVYCLRHGKEENASYIKETISFKPEYSLHYSVAAGKELLQTIEKELYQLDNPEKYQIIRISFFNSLKEEVDLSQDYIDLLLDWADHRFNQEAEDWGADPTTTFSFSYINEESAKRLESALKKRKL